MVLICRHWQTEWNRAGRLQWSQNSPLTQAGIVQGIRVWEILQQVWPAIRTIYSSPQERALDTSKIIANTLQIPHKRIITNDLLKEMSFWTHEWMQKKDRLVWECAQEIQDRTDDPYNVSLPGWENYSQVRKRAQEFIESTDLRVQDIIVAHEAFNRMLIWLLAWLSQQEALNIWQGNDLVYRYQSWTLDHKRVWDSSWSKWIITK